MDSKTEVEKFLIETGTVITIRKVGIIDRFPDDDSPTGNRFVYHVLIERGKKFYLALCYGSVYNYIHNIDINEYDVLATLRKYDPGNFLEFVNKYECLQEPYDKVYFVYKSCLFEYKIVQELFGDVLKRLQEI